MTTLYFLGTSASVASAARDNTSYLIKSDGLTALLDCPGSVVHKLTKLRVDFRAISHLFLTHSHPDHTYGFPGLLQSRLFVKSPLTVYGSRDTLQVAGKLAALYGLDNPKKYPPLVFKRIKAEQSFFKRRGCSISSFAVAHLPGSLGYSLRFGRTRVVISGDTAYSERVIRAAQGADILIHDCFCPDRIFREYPRLYSLHTSSLQLGELARLSRVKTVIPIHFASEVSYCFREILQEIRKNFRGRILMPSDLHSYMI